MWCLKQHNNVRIAHVYVCLLNWFCSNTQLCRCCLIVRAEDAKLWLSPFSVPVCVCLSNGICLEWLTLRRQITGVRLSAWTLSHQRISFRRRELKGETDRLKECSSVSLFALRSAHDLFPPALHIKQFTQTFLAVPEQTQALNVLAQQ